MRTKIINYITTWEKRCYQQGIPDEVPLQIDDMVPSYKKIAIAIMKNDYHLLSLGYTRPFCSFYAEIKRDEISKRKSTYKQLSLFDL